MVVCTGNICRSPLAEGLLRHYLEAASSEVIVCSAGTHALVGEAPDASAQVVAAQRGIDISGLRAEQCLHANVLESDVVLVMENHHREWLHANVPASRGRVFLMGKWHGDEAVPDPYRQDMSRFIQVGEMLERHCLKWSDWVTSH